MRCGAEAPDGTSTLAARLTPPHSRWSTYHELMAIERRPSERKGLASRADDVLLVLVVGVVALVALQVVSAVVGAILFVAKLAVVAAVVALVAAFLARRR